MVAGTAGRLPALEQLRDLLKERLVAEEDGSASASLARQYRETLREIDDLRRGTRKGSVVDELAGRRKSRGTKSTGRAAARGQGAQSRS